MVLVYLVFFCEKVMIMGDRNTLLKCIYKYFPPYSIFYANKRIHLQSKDKLFQEIVLKKLSKIFNSYAVVDWTEEESFCYEYKILLHENQPILDDDIELMKALHGERNDLWVFVSILAPYYYVKAEKTQYCEGDKWLFNNLIISDDKIQKLLIEIDKYFLDMGFSKLSDEDIKIRVPFVATELKSYNEVTVFDCLFTDYC